MKVKSVHYTDLPIDKRDRLKDNAVRIGFTEHEAINTVYYSLGDDNNVYGISESRIYKDWSNSNYKHSI